MTATQTGIAVGAVLALVAIIFSFWAMIGVALAMAVGALIGRIVEGKLDPTSLLDAVRGKRVSS